MKYLLTIIEGMVLFGIAIISPLKADPIQDISQNMSSGDSSARAAAMQNFVISLGTVKGQSYMTQAIPVLTTGLSDSDVDVRRNAASGLLMVAAVTAPVIRKPVPGHPDPFADPSIQRALLKATSDSDEVVRLSAIKAYASAYKLNPDLEGKMIQEFNAPESKTNDAGDKAAMIECLMLSRAPSEKAQTFLTNLLDDPKWGPHVANRMSTDHCPLGDAALDKLAHRLTQEKSPSNRADYASAIGAYGKRAQQYAPQLRSALANETDAVTKQNLQSALARTQ